MTQGSEGGNSSPKDDRARNEAAGEKQQVAKTKLDINMGDLIDPLSGATASKDAETVEEHQSDSKVAKTLLESDGPSLVQIKKLAESGKHSTPSNSSDADPESLTPENFKALKKELAKTLPESATLKKRADIEQSIQQETKEKKTSIKKLAKTIPEPGVGKEKLESDTSKQAEVPEENVSLKKLAKTIPDPQMQQRKAVAARIARIRSFQKTAQVKAKKFSKTMAESNFETLDVLQESGQWKSPSESTTKKIAPVREQFVVARTQLDHNILFQAVSDSKLKEEARVAQLLVEKSKEAPKPPPVPVKADRASSACPYKWEETDSKEKYRYCKKCQTPIYNFDGMERPEAEALIFNRENRDKFTLYSREDGKFTTVDCPVQKKRTKNLIMSIVAAVALVLGAVALLIFMPRPPAETTTSTSTTSSTSDSDMVTFSSTSTEKPSRTRKTTPNASSAGSGTGYQTFKLPSATQQQSEAPDPDEDGHFWKFD